MRSIGPGPSGQPGQRFVRSEASGRGELQVGQRGLLGVVGRGGHAVVHHVLVLDILASGSLAVRCGG